MILGCDLCRQREDGGKILSKDIINLGCIGRLEAEMNLCNFFIDKDATITCSLWHDANEYGVGDTICEKSNKVLFCPFCGANLADVRENMCVN